MLIYAPHATLIVLVESCLECPNMSNWFLEKQSVWTR